MKLSINRAKAQLFSVSNKDHSKPCRHLRQLVTASALLSTLIALPATAQTINEDIKIVASDAAADDQFGISVAISGTTAIVGAKGDDDAGSQSGSAYLYDTTTGQQLFKLTASDAAAEDRFGFSVAISGTTAIVGARLNDDAGNDSGSAYLIDTTTGQKLFKLTDVGGAASDRFGTSVAISGTTAIVGANQDDDNGNNSGSAFLFDTITGDLLFKLHQSNAMPNELFGGSVAISGNIAIVGAIGNSDNGNNSGSAYFFDTTTGQQLFKLTAQDAAADDWFGKSVAISGTTAIVGAHQNDDAGSDSGSAYLFDTATGLQLFKLTAADAAATDFFGYSVAISGTTAMVGAYYKSGTSANSGSAYHFDTTTGQQLFKLVASDAAANDRFGFSVAISGATSISGAILDSDAGSNSGSAYLFFVAPVVVQQPQQTIVTAGETAIITVAVSNTAGISYQWRRDGVDLTDGGNISGAQSDSLLIITTENDDAVYDCMLSNPALTTSDQAVLAVRPDPNACIVDLNNDGQLNFFDVSAFLAAFGAGCP